VSTVDVARFEVPVTATGASASPQSWIGEAATRRGVTALAVTLVAAARGASPLAEHDGDLREEDEAMGASG
jgi:hypothetical protein